MVRYFVDCVLVWVCLMCFGDEAGVIGSGRTLQRWVPLVHPVRGVWHPLSLLRWNKVSAGWLELVPGPCLALWYVLFVVIAWSRYFYFGRTFMLITLLYSSSFQMKTLGTWRASDLACIRSEPVWMSRPLPTLTTFCRHGHSWDTLQELKCL